MSAKHTPGWVAAPYHSDLSGFAVGLSKWEDGTACGCPPIGNDYLLLTSFELTEANARLIAAAPELLEGGEAQTSIIQRAQAVLTNYLIPDGIDAAEAINQLLGLFDGPDQRAAQARWESAIAKATQP